jgi:hypothetical protein
MRKGDRCVPKIAVYFSGYGHTASKPKPFVQALNR